MKLFSKSKPDHVKNVLVLGKESCGKRSFLLYYKDATSISDFALPEIDSLSQQHYVSDSKDTITVNFKLNRNSDRLIPSASFKKERFDAIVILVDLSAASASNDLKLYSNFVKAHFKGVSTIVVGTKADIKSKENDSLDLITTSSKTGEGFEQFKEQLNQSININPVSGSILSL